MEEHNFTETLEVFLTNLISFDMVNFIVFQFELRVKKKFMDHIDQHCNTRFVRMMISKRNMLVVLKLMIWLRNVIEYAYERHLERKIVTSNVINGKFY